MSGRWLYSLETLYELEHSVKGNSYSNNSGSGVSNEVRSSRLETPSRVIQDFQSDLSTHQMDEFASRHSLTALLPSTGEIEGPPGVDRTTI
jgi:hypothetical protein